MNDLLTTVRLFLFYLLRKWVYLLIAFLIGGLAGYGYYYMQAPKYKAECTFVLDEKSGGSGGLSSIASSLGVDIGSLMGGSSSLFAYDNLLEILQSRRIVETVLLSETDPAHNNHQTLADLYLDFTKLRIKYDKKPRTAGVHFTGPVNRENFTPVQDSILYEIYKNVLKQNFIIDRANKKTQIFKVDVTSKNEVFSKLLSERVVAEAKSLYINIKTGTAQRNVDRLQQKADSLLVLLTGKSYESATTQVLNANPAMKTVAIPARIASRNETLIGTLYAEVVKNLETTKTALMLQTPVIQILDAPRFPLVNLIYSIKICIAFGMLIALLAGIARFGYLFFYKKEQ